MVNNQRNMLDQQDSNRLLAASSVGLYRDISISSYITHSYRSRSCCFWFLRFQCCVVMIAALYPLPIGTSCIFLIFLPTFCRNFY